MRPKFWIAILLASAAGLGRWEMVRIARARQPVRPPPVVVSPVVVVPVKVVDQMFTDGAHGIRLCYPGGFHAEPSKTAELAVASTDGAVHLALDVPDLGWRPPIIPLGMVTQKYTEALRDHDMPDAKVVRRIDLTVAGASARCVRCDGHQPAGPAWVDQAVVIVHDRRVFILSVDSDPAHADAAAKTLDGAVASIVWAK